jgi:ribonuclease HI
MRRHAARRLVWQDGDVEITEPADSPLKDGRYLLNTDASVESDGHPEHGDAPGEAAIGIVLHDPHDREVTTYSQKIGPHTIPEAEYKALIKGLEIALDLRIEKIRAFVDNQLVVDQIHGLAAVKSELLKPLHAQVIETLKRFPDHRVYWVPRERNQGADQLAGDELRKAT